MTCELSFDDAPQLVVLQIVSPRGGDEIARETSGRAQPLFSCSRAAAAGDESAGAVSDLDHTFLLEFPVHTDHGVRVDDESLGESTNAGQRIVGCKRAGFRCVKQLLLELQVDRDT